MCNAFLNSTLELSTALEDLETHSCLEPDWLSTKRLSSST